MNSSNSQQPSYPTTRSGETRTTGERAQHLAWCKRRALEYVDSGDLTGAFASMASDMSKHEGTADHRGIDLGMNLLLIGSLSSREQMRRFIEGFN